MTNAELVHQLGSNPTSRGRIAITLSRSILGILIGEGRVMYKGARQRKTNDLVSEGSSLAGPG